MRTHLLAAVGGVAFAALFAQAGCSKTDTASMGGAPGSVPAAAADPAPPPPPPPAAVPPITLAEGSALKIRTTTAISTETHKTGDAFTATLEQPLAQGDRVIAPKGSRVDGIIAESDPGGRVQGRAQLIVKITRLHLPDGQSVELASSSVERLAPSTRRRDALKIGIGSGAGAAIGAIAGGGKGAAIGAAAGGAAGAGVVAATHGDPAVLASESVLSFKLRAPATLR